MRTRLVKMVGTAALQAALAALLAGATLAAQQRPMGAAERRAELYPLYLSLQTDRVYVQLSREADAAPGDATALDRLLRHMPLSPLEAFEIDMETRRYEVAVPLFIQERHERWVVLHEERARELYGDDEVDRVLSAWPADTGEEIVDATKTVVGTNRNVAATAVPNPANYQGEIQIAANPSNTNQIVAAANTWDTMGGACGGGIQAVFYSSDGGATWGYTCAPGRTAYPTLPNCAGTVFGSDPAVYWNGSNEVFLNYMLICFSGGANHFAMVVARSTNGGATWTGQGVVQNSWATTTVEDKNFYVIDTTPTSPFFGRHYTCWDRANNERMAYSTNSGVNWVQVDLPAAAAGTLDLGCEMAVQKNGNVHLVFNTLDCGVTSCTNERMFYTRSTNGGVSWSAPVLVRDFDLVSFSGVNLPDAQDNRGINPFGAIDIDNSGGACDGTLYVVYSDRTANANDTDVYLSRSTNNGASWSAPLQLNDDFLTARAQFHPFVQVNQANGNVIAVWHDTRNDPQNDAIDIYSARSTDCGVSLEGNVRVTQNSIEFNNSGISFSDENTADNPNRNPNQYGEYLGLDVKGGKAFVAWTDTRHFFPGSATNAQRENLGFASVDLNSGPITLVFQSIASEDGYTTESTETSNVGGESQAFIGGAAAIQVGDTSSDQQTKGVLSFDTAPLPDAATIQSIRIRMRRGMVSGSSPFTVLAGMHLEIRTGPFNGNNALEAADFQAAATNAGICTLPTPALDGDWTECSFTGGVAGLVNKTGRTQFKIVANRDDDDDNSSDWMGFYSGEDAYRNRPRLEVTFTP